jgi:Ca2+-dependent lipid-binding protein
MLYSKNTRQLTFENFSQALKNMDGLFGKSDPFYTISRVDDAGSLSETSSVVYTSNVLHDELHPRWGKARIPLNKLTKGATTEVCQILVEVWDKDTYSKNDLIGSVRIALHQIQSGLEVALTPADATTSHHGSLIFEKCRVEMKYYTRQGGITNPSLVRYYAQHVWNLPNPQGRHSQISQNSAPR